MNVSGKFIEETGCLENEMERFSVADRKINWRRAVILLISLLLLCIVVPLKVSAGETDIETVRVGYYEDGDYMSVNQQGEYVGYNIEYIQEFAKQSGIQFEIIDAGSWSKAYEMLETGEIDILPSVYYTQERAGQILFVEQPMCNIYTTLNVRMEDERYAYNDFAAFEGMKVGIIRGGVDGERFKDFCKEHEVTLDIMEYDETDKLLGALGDGTLDGVAITHLGKNSVFRSVAQFAPSPLYIAVTATNPELHNKLNEIMDSILLSNPNYSADLYDKYLAPSMNQKPVFTKEERKYIEQAKTIVVSYDPAFAPLSYQDEKTGEFKGVTADIFEFIAENCGLTFEFEAHSQSEALELVRQGKIDALCLSDGDYLWDGKNNINSTIYYLSTPTSMITRSGSEEWKVMALPEGYHLSETVEKDNPDCEIQMYPSVEECLKAVQKGEADVTYINTQVAGFLLDKASNRSLNAATLGQYMNKMCIGVSASADPSLFSVLNKCIQYLPVEEADSFMVKNSTDAKNISIAEFLGLHIWLVAGGISLILGIIIFLISVNLRNELHKNRRIQELLYKDDLTGLDSINGFNRKWTGIKQKALSKEYAILYGDICQFKLINDNFGFAVGDDVLRMLAKVLQHGMGDDEVCCRISADNFAVLMQYESWKKLMNRLEAVVSGLDDWRREHTEIPYKINVVFGVYPIDRKEDRDLSQMLDFANYAKHYAKEPPGRLAVLYDEKMRMQAKLARLLESGLERALKEDEFEVFYQPKVSIEDGTVIGSEALVRWNHPTEGFLMPGTFIPLFEKNGMVQKVDFWVFEDVCRTMHRWKSQGKVLLPVSCNFSRIHFVQPDFTEHICSVADEWGIPHHLLEIEITESALIEESGIIEAVLPQIKELGFKIAIDDFGSGYSSLGQLQRLPADVLKLDRSFVCRGITGKREQTVIKSMIVIARELGMKVICEGVENQTQSDILRELGCHYIQGFYYYRPMNCKDYEMLIGKDEFCM